MTTIVYDPVTGMLAADHRMTWEPTGYDDNCEKIDKGKDFFIVHSGSTGLYHRLIADLGGDLSQVPFEQIFSAQSALDSLNARDGICNISLFAFNRGRPQIWELFASSIFHPANMNKPFAMGSGAHFALGAVSAGASVMEAIEIASRFCNGTSPECTVIEPFKILQEDLDAQNAITRKAYHVPN